MEFITTTELRTKSPQLLDQLSLGRSIRLIHRSKFVGIIKPANKNRYKTISSQNLQEKIDNLSLPLLTIKEIDRRYRIAMTKKHGQGLR
jgi:hypothetical protein